MKKLLLFIASLLFVVGSALAVSPAHAQPSGTGHTVAGQTFTITKFATHGQYAVNQVCPKHFDKSFSLKVFVKHGTFIEEQKGIIHLTQMNGKAFEDEGYPAGPTFTENDFYAYSPAPSRTDMIDMNGVNTVQVVWRKSGSNTRIRVGKLRGNCSSQVPKSESAK